METVLGLDLGVSSIGWALIGVDGKNNPICIKQLGVRGIPMESNDSQEYCQGKSFTKNQERTKKRIGRRCYERYKQRRERLTSELRKLGMLPDEKLIKLPVLDLWNLRARAAKRGEQVSLAELGRVLYHINQKRGYKHAKSDNSDDAKKREYVKCIDNRYQIIQELGQTIGQYFSMKLQETAVNNKNGTLYIFRIKDEVFPRKAYEDEFDRIMECQKEFYPDILTSRSIEVLRNEVIFYQRNLKSCKHLVSLCEFEKREYTNSRGEVVFDGPKVAACSNPLYQLDRIWEAINNIRLKNKLGSEYPISLEQKRKIAEYLQIHPLLKLTALYKILGITKYDGWYPNESLKKGIKGNTTYQQLAEALQDEPGKEDLLQFNLVTIPTTVCDEETGELLQAISPECVSEPLYDLWHLVYSIEDKEELRKALKKKHNIENEATIDRLYSINFKKEGYGKKSVKMIRRILPYLQEGLKYSDACEYVGINHSDSLTKEENQSRVLLDKIPLLKKNELHQPIVEKILNQTINIVNAIIETHGSPTTIRVELARELKQSRDERKLSSSRRDVREKQNKEIVKRLAECGIEKSRNRIERYRLWEEAGKKCFYCGKTMGYKESLLCNEMETEHIIPKSLFFDNSYSNKVCACRECNSKKGNMTGYDYMKSLSENDFENYITRINDMFVSGNISKTKKDRLLTKGTEIPQDFIDRDLRLTQYIARKATAILKTVCNDVSTSTGSVTDFIRHTWGYDKILHHINFERYKRGNLTATLKINHKGQTSEEEVIADWSKRFDHRHHAIDALVVAMTSQSVIQRLNTLNASRETMYNELETKREDWEKGFSLLRQWLKEKKHFSVAQVQDAISQIIVSFKCSRKVTTPGKRYVYKNGKKIVLQKGILIPRDALHEDSLYGERFCQETSEKKYVKRYVVGIGSQGFLFTGKEKYKEECKVDKNGVKSIKVTDDIQKVLSSVMDTNIRRRILNRLNEGFVEGEDYRNDVKKALNNLRNLVEQPIYADDRGSIPIKSVRCYTGESTVVPVRFDEAGKPLGFVKPGNNHHVAIYQDTDGNYHESVVTFWQAVERRKYKLPVIISSPDVLWKDIQDKNLPEDLLESLPLPHWRLVITLQKNETFVLGMDEDEFHDAIKQRNYQKLNNYLYRVQNISSLTYRFSLSTTAEKFEQAKANKEDRRFLSIRSIKTFFELNPYKIKVNVLGEIVDRN